MENLKKSSRYCAANAEKVKELRRQYEQLSGQTPPDVDLPTCYEESSLGVYMLANMRRYKQLSGAAKKEVTKAYEAGQLARSSLRRLGWDVIWGTDSCIYLQPRFTDNKVHTCAPNLKVRKLSQKVLASEPYRQRIIESNMWILAVLSRIYHYACSFPLEDLVQIGAEKLTEVSRTYEPGSSAAFATYAYKCIRRRYQEITRSGDLYHRANMWQDIAVKATDKLESSFVQKNKRFPTDSELVAALKEASVAGKWHWPKPSAINPDLVSYLRVSAQSRTFVNYDSQVEERLAADPESGRLFDKALTDSSISAALLTCQTIVTQLDIPPIEKEAFSDYITHSLSRHPVAATAKTAAKLGIAEATALIYIRHATRVLLTSAAFPRQAIFEALG